MDRPKQNIGIYGQAGQDVFQQRVAGILRYCDEVGGLLLRDFQTPDMVDDFTRPPPWTGRVDGMVVMMGKGEVTSQFLADWLLSAGTPTVSVGSDWFDARIPAFVVNTESLAQLAARHLIDCRCNSFLFVGYGYSTGSAARAGSLRDVLALSWCDLEQVSIGSILTGSFADEALLRDEAELVLKLQSMRKPLGVWTLNDNFASAVCRLCDALGLAVPETVKVLGADDMNIARIWRPTISSIRTPGDEIGYLAAKTLHQMLAKKPVDYRKTEVRATELVARESTVASPQHTGDLAAVRDYIQRHACAGVTIEQLVDLVGVSRRTFEEWFRREAGHSPGREIQRVRLQRAKHLVRTTNLSMTQIALMIGYTEAAAFSKFFRKSTGMSPRDYRRSAAAEAGVVEGRRGSG